MFVLTALLLYDKSNEATIPHSLPLFGAVSSVPYFRSLFRRTLNEHKHSLKTLVIPESHLLQHYSLLTNPRNARNPSFSQLATSWYNGKRAVRLHAW